MAKKSRKPGDSVNMRPEDFQLLSYGPKREEKAALPDPLKKLRELRELHNLTRKGTK